MPPVAVHVGEVDDSSWEQAVEFVRTALATAETHFEESLANAGAEPKSLDALLVGDRAAIAAVIASNDGDLLQEVALDLAVDALRRRVAARFFASFDRGREEVFGETLRLPWQWGDLLRQRTAALQRLRLAHLAVLECVVSKSNDVIAEYQTAFSVSFRESWPASFSSMIQAYFRRTWRPHRIFSAQQVATHTGEQEWWWVGASGGRAERILILLDTCRRPSLRSCAMETHSLCDDGADSSLDDTMEVDISLAPSSASSTSANDAEGEEPAAECISNTLRELSMLWNQIGLAILWRDLVMKFSVEELGRTVRKRCSSEYDVQGLLGCLACFLYSTLLRWLRTAHGLPVLAGPSVDSVDLEVEEIWRVAARWAVLQLFETFVEVRICEAFDMIRDFPESAPALEDLRRCLARTGQTALLVAALRKQFARRLLIAGAHTRDIIKVYIKTIKAMRLVDPRGVLLDAVSAPIRSYLRRRKDTVRCIVTALTEDTELQAELHLGTQAQPVVAKVLSSGVANRTTGAFAARVNAGNVAQPVLNGNGVAPQSNALGHAGSQVAPETLPPRPVEQSDFTFGGADMDGSDEDEDPDAWMPDPMDSDPVMPSRQRRAQDVISLLVGIYGSKEMFIKEYKEMLADKLLSNPSYTTDRETQNLELLKTRFGEIGLAHCEVMLQDIKDSKRTNLNVQQHAAARRQQLQPLQACEDGGEFAPTGNSSRAFMAPFSLSNIFGLCLSPGDTGAQQPTGEHSASGAMVPVTNAGVTPLEQGKLSLDHVKALVLSQHYWPVALSQADHLNFRLPQALEDVLTEYGATYKVTRAKRSLQWKRAHGLVEVTIELADRSFPVTVTPVHLAVLACFTGEASSASMEGVVGDGGQPLSLHDVASHLGLPEALTRKRLGFWVSKGVLREVNSGTFVVQESLPAAGALGQTATVGLASKGAGGRQLDELDTEHSPGVPAGSGACAAELESCDAFIQNMLTNHSASSLGQIHHFLQMFMRDPPYTQTEAQLRTFLTQLCQDGRLEFNGSDYSLAHKG